MDETKKMLLKVAYYYYKCGITQGEIAKKLKTSRQRVNRLLKRVRDEGIVKIHISGISESHVDLETKLEELYGLNRAIVVSNLGGSEKDIYEALGIAGAEYLTSILKDDMVIGMSWGTTLFSVANNLPRLHNYKNISVVQLVGSLNDNKIKQSDEITRLVSEKLNGTPYFLFAPSYVNESLKNELMKDENIKTVFDKMKCCDAMLFSVGGVSTYYNAISNIIKTENYDLVVKSGGVGNIALRFYDAFGEFLDSKVNDKVMGIDVETIKSIPELVCISGGQKKTAAIAAGLRGGFINTLITDSVTAQSILEFNYQQSC